MSVSFLRRQAIFIHPVSLLCNFQQFVTLWLTFKTLSFSLHFFFCELLQSCDRDSRVAIFSDSFYSKHYFYSSPLSKTELSLPLNPTALALSPKRSEKPPSLEVSVYFYILYLLTSKWIWVKNCFLWKTNDFLKEPDLVTGLAKLGLLCPTPSLS